RHQQHRSEVVPAAARPARNGYHGPSIRPPQERKYLAGMTLHLLTKLLHGLVNGRGSAPILLAPGTNPGPIRKEPCMSKNVKLLAIAAGALLAGTASLFAIDAAARHGGYEGHEGHEGMMMMRMHDHESKMAEADTNGDGAIDAAEWNAMFAKI